MDTAWQTSIDRTLRSTEATLEGLQHRRTSYDRAKHKVDDYLGYSTPHRDGGGFDSLDRGDLSVPPPLPSHRRYHSTRDTILDSGEPHYSTSAAGPSPRLPPPTQQQQQSASSSGAGRRANGLSSREDPTAPLQLVNAQVRGALLELELEKAKRADGIRELAYRTTAELAELRSIVTQLQGENASLRTSVRALEGKLGFVPEQRSTTGGGGAVTPLASFSGITASSQQQQQQQQSPSRTALLASAVSTSGFALPSANAGVSASLLARVDALESGLARQQQLGEERQTRTATVLREMVKAELAVDMAAVRTLAREAARDSTEELVKLRLSAVQSNVQTEVQRALRVASAGETIAQQAQLQCGEVEHRLSAQMQKLSAQVVEWQRGAAASAGSVVAFGGHGSSGTTSSQERQQQFERAVEDELHTLRGQLRQLRQDTEAHVQRTSQEQRHMSTQLHLKAAVDDLRVVADRVEEQEQQRRGSAGATALRESVNAVLRPQLQQMQEALHKVQEQVTAQQEAAEGWRRQAGLRFAAVDASTKELQDEVDRHDQQVSNCVKEARQARSDAAAATQHATDTVRQRTTELAEAWETKLQAVEDRTQVSAKERHQQLEGLVRQLQQSMTEQHEAAQRSRLASDALEERLRRAEAAVTATESTAAHETETVRAKVEALYTVVQQTCTLPLSRVQQDVEAAQRRLAAQDEDRARVSAVWTQQLTEARHFLEEHVRNVRDMLEQRVAHQRELWEELRSQLVVQRRHDEEQQQQTLEQIMRLQLQQQQLQQQYRSPPVVSATVAPPVRSASEEPTSVIAAGSERTDIVPAAVADATASAVAATSAAVTALGQQLQLFPQRLQSVEARVAAVEHAAADAVAPLQRQLEELQAQLSAERQAQQQRQTAVEHAMAEQARTAADACERVAVTGAEQLRHLESALSAATAPPHIAVGLCGSVESLQQLALHMQERLDLPPGAAQALADLQAQTAQHATALDALQSSVRETQLQVSAAATEAAAERAAAADADAAAETSAAPPGQPGKRLSSQVVADLCTGLDAVRAAHAALQQQHTALAAEAHRITTEHLPALTSTVESLASTTLPLPQRLDQVSEELRALQATQRQQLPTLQTYVQEVMDVVKESQAAALDPLQMKLRALEERQRRQQTSLEEWMAEQASVVEQTGQAQEKKAAQRQRDAEARTAAQLGDVEERLARTEVRVVAMQGEVDSLVGGQREAVETMTALRAQTEAAAATMKEQQQQQRQAVVATAAARARSDDVEDAPAATAADTAAIITQPLAQLQAYVEELEGRLSLLEEQTSDAAADTTDALSAFGQQLQDVVARFAATVEGREGEGAAAAADPATSTSAVVTTDGATITSLEDVFAYFLRQLQQLQRALSRLQANTVETLEILEQHEESTAALPMLQHTVDAIAAALVPLAERLGVEATDFSLPTGAVDEYGDVYPPSSRDGSESTLEDR